MAPEKKALAERTRGLESCGRGTCAGYASGCRCDACRNAVVEYNRGRRRAMAYGKPSKRVEAGPVIMRVRRMLESGYSERELSRLTGLGLTTIHRLSTGKGHGGKPLKHVSRFTKDAVCMARGRSLYEEQLVDASEIARDVSRWKESGMTVKHIAESIGCGREVLDKVLHGERKKVRAKTLYRFRMAKPGLDREAGSYLPDAWEVLGL